MHIMKIPFAKYIYQSVLHSNLFCNDKLIYRTNAGLKFPRNNILSIYCFFIDIKDTRVIHVITHSLSMSVHTHSLGC